MSAPLTRDRIATAVEILVDVLDMLDGDADLEPSLGAPENHPSPEWFRSGEPGQDRWAAGNRHDLEDAAA